MRKTKKQYQQKAKARVKRIRQSKGSGQFRGERLQRLVTFLARRAGHITWDRVVNPDDVKGWATLDLAFAHEFTFDDRRFGHVTFWARRIQRARPRDLSGWRKIGPFWIGGIDLAMLEEDLPF